MKRYLNPICIFLFCHIIGISEYTQASPPVADHVFFKLKTQIETYQFSYNEDVVRSLLNQALDQIGKYPNRWYPRYYSGLINIQLGNIFRADDRKLAYRYYKEALKHVQIAHKQSPNSENTIVLANVYGKLASLKTFKMLYYGSKSKSYLMDAFQMNERNPKSYLLAGIEIMWTPMIFGGSKKRAREFLNNALVLESTWQETDRFIVRWATPAEIFAHLAQLEILCETLTQARHYAAKALHLIPDYGFVRRDVIPQID